MSAIQTFTFYENLNVHAIIKDATNTCFFNAQDVAVCLHIEDMQGVLRNVDPQHKDMWFMLNPKLDNYNAPCTWNAYTLFVSFAGVYQMSQYSSRVDKQLFLMWIYDDVLADVCDIIGQRMLVSEMRLNSDMIESLEKKIAQLRLRLFDQMSVAVKDE